MAQKTAISGTVEAVNAERGSFKVGDKWYERANASNSNELPAQGSTVSFDAYGQKQNIWYRFTSTGGGNGNGLSGAGAPSGGSNGTSLPGRNGHSVRSDGPVAIIGGARQSALIAAATLLQGSEGNVEQVASNVVTIAKAFELYLVGSKPADEEMI